MSERRSWILLAAAIFLSGRDARADAQACEDASVQGQKLTKKVQLIEAREAFKQCLDTACPQSVRDDCSAFLADVNARLPTVVLVASIDGKQATSVSVTIDGKPAATKLDGLAIELNPGVHTFVFTTSDGRTQTVEHAVSESKKSQEISAVFVTAAATPVPAAATPTSGSPTTPATDETRWSTLKYVGLGTAALGAVVTGVGAVLAMGGASKFNDANHCGPDEPQNYEACQPGGSLHQAKADGRSQNTFGYVLVGVGAAVVTTGVILFVVAPSSSKNVATGVTHVGVSPGGFSLVGRF